MLFLIRLLLVEPEGIVRQDSKVTKSEADLDEGAQCFERLANAISSWPVVTKSAGPKRISNR